MKIKHLLRMKYIVIPVLIILSITTFGQNKRNDSLIQKTGKDLDIYLTSMISSQKYVGLAACLIKDDKIIWKGSYGYADRENEKKLNCENIYQLASLSKTVTATALMLLYDKGLFKLDDDINNYIPIKVRNPKFKDKPITFRMLLTHTSSCSDLTPTGNKFSYGVYGDSKTPLAEYVEELFTPGGKYYSADYFSSNEPGTKYEYSNMSFSLIGYLVEKIAKKDFSEFCKENIFIPLNMKNTGWHLSDLDTNKIVFTYMLLPSDSVSYKKIQHFGLPGYPEGMLRTTLDDFKNFVSTFINNGKYENFQLLKPSTVALMLEPQNVMNIPSRSFKVIDIGLTWLIMDVDGHQMYSMNGFSGGIFTNTYFSPEDKIGFIYYFTGLSMKNMQAMLDITKKLYTSLKSLD